MDDLIADIQERTGLPTDTVVEVVTMVADYLRQALPDDLVQQVAAHLGNAAESATDIAGSTTSAAAKAGATAASSASAVIGTAAGAASSTVGIARDALNNLTGDDDG